MFAALKNSNKVSSHQWRIDEIGAHDRLVHQLVEFISDLIRVQFEYFPEHRFAFLVLEQLARVNFEKQVEVRLNQLEIRPFAHHDQTKP